jgi:dienelactone hydrolase
MLEGDRPGVRPVVYGRVAVALILLCGLGAVIATRFFALPAPTGPYPVGTATMTFGRAPSATAPAGQYVVQLWYPAKTAGPRARWGTGGPGFAKFVYHRFVRSAATKDAAAIATPEKLPLLMYLPGWGGQRTDNTGLAEELASHGYVIAAMSDTVFDTPSIPRLSVPMDLSTPASYKATLEIGREKSEYGVRRASDVLAELLNGNAALPPHLRGRFDRDRIGIYGFSFGGAIALATALRDPRFKSAMNLDGWIVTAGTFASRKPAPAYALLSGIDAPLTQADAESEDATARYSAELDRSDVKLQREHLVGGGGVVVAITGVDHFSFCDQPRYALTHWSKTRVDPQRMAGIIGEYAVAFFDETLNGRVAAQFAPNAPHDPAVTVERWPATNRLAVAPR